MNFDELWQKMSEAIDPYDPALESRIRFSPKLGGATYTGKWKVDGPEGELRFVATAIKQLRNLPHTDQPMNSYGVLFEDKSSGETTLTGRAGPAASTVYNGLLIFIRKVLEDQASRGTPVQALSFTEGEPDMKPLYERFFKMFLADKFVRYDEKTLISKEAVEEIKRLRPGQSDEIERQIRSAHEEQQRKIDDIRAQRMNARALRGANG